MAPTGSARAVAQAKVNLFLRVIAREQSGYHQIETLFCRLELGDVVTVFLGEPDRTVVCRGPMLPEGGLGRPEDNLAYRAAEAYLQAAEWRTGFRIEIEKRIPVGGGLGGGSADAAAVLRALDALNSELDAAVSITDLAMSIGSDVPFLVEDAALAFAWGRGERMLMLPPLPKRHVALLVPSFAVSTVEAYGWLAKLRSGRTHMPAPRLVPLAALTTWELLETVADNDFEPVVLGRHPQLRLYTRALEEHGARVALMSGSGSTVFGVFDGVPDAAALEKATGCRVLLTQTAERVVPVHLLG